jgi:hypothetical protein
VRYYWRRRRNAVREGIFGSSVQAQTIREVLYEYVELRSRFRTPLLGRSWMPQGKRSADEALILEGRRQVVIFLERLAGLSSAQLDELERRSGTTGDE